MWHSTEQCRREVCDRPLVDDHRPYCSSECNKIAGLAYGPALERDESWSWIAPRPRPGPAGSQSTAVGS